MFSNVLYSDKVALITDWEWGGLLTVLSLVEVMMMRRSCSMLA